ncbi:MAG: ACT domain-containing protein, partial [Smithellaceae bacterium]|nr:ACT domain-containing protein [Smithellaceae bacterium]
MNEANAILHLYCPDQKGLVANISNFIFRHNGNIVHADQHTSLPEKMFFMRVEWELAGFGIPRDEIAEAFRPLAEQFRMKWDLRFSDASCRIAIFCSRHMHCLHDLILRHRMGEFRADITLVVSNHLDMKPLVEQFGLSFFHFPITSENKLKQEKKELALLKEQRIDLVVLARY